MSHSAKRLAWTLIPMMTLAAALLVLSSADPVLARPDEAAIRATALDYIEGWYAGDGDRMARALHPDLVKRIVLPDSSGEMAIHEQDATVLIDNTRSGRGSRTPAEQQRTDVEILDVYGNVASVKVTAGDWVDYLHIAHFADGYKIVNVLWELTPEAKERMAARRSR